MNLLCFSDTFLFATVDGDNPVSVSAAVWDVGEGQEATI